MCLYIMALRDHGPNASTIDFIGRVQVYDNVSPFLQVSPTLLLSTLYLCMIWRNGLYLNEERECMARTMKGLSLGKPGEKCLLWWLISLKSAFVFSPHLLLPSLGKIVWARRHSYANVWFRKSPQQEVDQACIRRYSVDKTLLRLRWE